MIMRALTLASGLAGAAGLSQFPEFSQQYMQRLGGAVDELNRQVTRYENDAARLDMPLQTYLAALVQEGEMARTQAANMAEDIARHDRLAATLAAMENAGPFMRARLAIDYLPDGEVAARALETFRPAVPATFEGAVFGGLGFVTGWASLALGVALLGGAWRITKAPFRRRTRP